MSHFVCIPKHAKFVCVHSSSCSDISFCGIYSAYLKQVQLDRVHRPTYINLKDCIRTEWWNNIYQCCSVTDEFNLLKQKKLKGGKL